jgi:branched-chain amino acid transport system substrate-binding protein
VNNRSFKLVGIAVVAASLAFTGCGSRTEASSGGSAGGGSSSKVAKIGVIAPLSGDLSALGLGIRNSVDLAIRQANESNAIPGWKLELAAEDDEAKPDTGKNAATKLASDDAVVGVVGTLNSSVAQSVIPVLDSAKIVQVSPANTNPALTKGADYINSPKRPNPNYFRTCTTDAVQGPFAAQYLLGEGIKKVATIHDKKSYGQGLVSEFTKAFTAGGGEVVAAETINPDDKNFSAVISKVQGSSPEAVYYGGEYPQAGPLSKQMKSAGLKVPLMGGDGIYSGEFIKLGGTDGDLATSVGAPVETLDSAKPFVDGYKAAGFSEGYEAYGAYSYDAATAIINALKTSLQSASDAKSARQATIDAMAKVNFQGATGTVGFDEFGDSVSRVLTVYAVTNGAYAPKKTGELK